MERICENCGQPFVPKRSDAAYCGHSCRQLAYLTRKGLIESQNLGSLKYEPTRKISDIGIKEPKIDKVICVEGAVPLDAQKLDKKEYESSFLNHIQLRIAVRNRDAVLSIFDLRHPALSQWINTRFLCLVESLLCMSEMKIVELDDLKEICNAFHVLLNSDNFQNMPFNYPYTNEMVKYYETIRLFCGRSQDEAVTVKFTRTTKAELIAARYELAQFVKWIKFDELEFDE